MRALSIGSADAFILVYDISDSCTFEEVKLIRDQIHECKGTAAVPIVVVGNKVDLETENSDVREVSITVVPYKGNRKCRLNYKRSYQYFLNLLKKRQ